MKNIEKSLRKYTQGNEIKQYINTLCMCEGVDVNHVINILFKIINEELSKIKNLKSLERIKEMLKSIGLISTKYDTVDKKYVFRMLNKLDEKISRLESERKNKKVNLETLYKEIDATRDKLETKEKKEKIDSHKYDFIECLVDLEEYAYLEHTFNYFPNFVNTTNKDKKSLFRTILEKWTESLINDNDDEALYYENFINLILSKKSFVLKGQEKRKCLSTLYTSKDKLSNTKKKANRNKEKIARIESLINYIKDANNKSKNIEIFTKKYNINISFSESLEKKVRLLEQPKKGTMTDRKFVDDYIITIDKDNAIEIDDGLSCEKLANGNFLLGVHIASVLGYFPYESDIVREAINRNKSIYLPGKYMMKNGEKEGAILIFPYDFSANKASLLAETPKLARSYYYEIDKYGNIVDEKFLKTIITSAKKATYDEIDQIIKYGSDDAKLEQLIENLCEVTDILDKKYSITDFYEKVKESTSDYSDLRVNRHGSQKIVYQSMLLTGNRVATFFADNGFPCLYRVHEVNERNLRILKEMINNFKNKIDANQFNQLYRLIEGIYPKSRYDISGAHSGLGLEHHCHCTSELRRGADIVVEHALEVCYDRKPTDKELYALLEEIKRKSKIINAKDKTIDCFMSDFNRVYRKQKR